MATILDDWRKHALATETMKTQSLPDYHQMAGYNFAQNFPAIAESGIGAGVAKGYQYGQELGRWGLGELGIGPNINLSDAWETAGEQSDLNILGFKGEGFNMDEYNQFMNKFGYETPEKGTIAFDPNKINKTGMLDWGWAGPGPYLLNQGIGAGLGFLRSKFQKGQSRKRVEDQRKQIQEAQVQREANQVRQNIQRYGSGDRPDTGMNRPGGGRGRSPTGGNVAGTPFARGGLIDLYRYGGFI
jgi:hypothetical protein